MASVTVGFRVKCKANDWTGTVTGMRSKNHKIEYFVEWDNGRSGWLLYAEITEIVMG